MEATLRILPHPITALNSSMPKKRLHTINHPVHTDLQIELYALYKQATQGPNQDDGSEWGCGDVGYEVGKKKQAAWQALGDMDKQQAEEKFVCLVEEIKASG